MESLLAVEEARPTALPLPQLGIVPGGTVDAARRLLAKPTLGVEPLHAVGSGSVRIGSPAHASHPGSTRSTPSG